MSRTAIPDELVHDGREPTYAEFLESRIAFIRDVIHDGSLSRDEQFQRIETLIQECIEAQARLDT